MQKHNLEYESYLYEGSFTASSGYEMATQMLQNPILPTAIFTANDAIAFGAIKAIKEHNLSVPEDISVIGFNDTEMCSYITPALTTIHAPAYDMGQHGANLIYTARSHNITTPLKAKIPCYLVERESCRDISKN
jgi:LacI family transcriptional regulator